MTGLVRVATTEAIAVMLVREGLLSLRARHPELEIELLGENRVVDLAGGEAPAQRGAACAQRSRARVVRTRGDAHAGGHLGVPFALEP